MLERLLDLAYISRDTTLSSYRSMPGPLINASGLVRPGLPLAPRMSLLMLGPLINAFNWRLENGVAPENRNMEDKFRITMQQA